MLHQYLTQTSFNSIQDFRDHFQIKLPEHFNFAYDVVDVRARESPDKEALYWVHEGGEVRHYSFGELKELSDRCAAYFTALHIGRGDAVMLILKRRPEFWITLLALHKIGAVTIPATHMLTAKDLEYRLNAAEIKMVVGAPDPAIAEQVDLALPHSPSLLHRLWAGEVPPQGWESLPRGMASAPCFEVPDPRPENRDTLLVYFTSGSAGEPKMVAHDHFYPLGHLVTGAFWHKLHSGSLHLTVADTGWGKAVWGKLYGQWLAGAAVFVYDHEKFKAGELLEVMARHRVTSFCAPPTVYRYLVKEDLRKYDLSVLEHCTTAGEPFNPSVSETWFRATGLRVREGFGQTETTLTLGCFPWMAVKPGSMGFPNPQYKVALLRPDGSEAPAGECGELVIDLREGRPPGLMQGYYKDPVLTARIIYDGFYHTRDLAWRDAEGYYWFVGRTDDVIKSSGYRISPFEVESAVNSHPAVLECAVTGVPHPERGQVVKATIVLAPGYENVAQEALAKEIQAHVKRVSAPYKYPRVVEFVPRLPKTISGKIRRGELREKDAAVESGGVGEGKMAATT